MKTFALAAFALSALGGCRAIPENASDPLCAPLREFVASVGPGSSHAVVFHTSWGSGFKGEESDSLYAKRCTHNGYAPAMKVCDALMESGAVEFSGNNAKRAVVCLSKDTHFAGRLQLHHGEFAFAYGSENRGALLTVSFAEDPDVGAMALRIAADGY